MKTATFKHYANGYYTFEFESGEDIVFEEVHPKVLNQFNLREDASLKGKKFRLSFSEQFEDDDWDLVIYRVETLKPV